VSDPSDALEIVIRPMIDSDLALVQHSWKKGYIKRGPCKWVPERVAFTELNHRIRSLLKVTQVLVACNPQDSDSVFGWVCFDPVCLHYVYVKNTFRGAHVAWRLLVKAEELGGTLLRTSHVTDMGLGLFDHMQTPVPRYMPSLLDKHHVEFSSDKSQ